MVSPAAVGVPETVRVIRGKRQASGKITGEECTSPRHLHRPRWSASASSSSNSSPTVPVMGSSAPATSSSANTEASSSGTSTTSAGLRERASFHLSEFTVARLTSMSLSAILTNPTSVSPPSTISPFSVDPIMNRLVRSPYHPSGSSCPSSAARGNDDRPAQASVASAYQSSEYGQGLLW